MSNLFKYLSIFFYRYFSFVCWEEADKRFDRHIQTGGGYRTPRKERHRFYTSQFWSGSYSNSQCGREEPSAHHQHMVQICEYKSGACFVPPFSDVIDIKVCVKLTILRWWNSGRKAEVCLSERQCCRNKLIGKLCPITLLDSEPPLIHDHQRQHE